MADEKKLLLNPNKGIATDHVIYTELDAILDTRLGTLHCMNEQFAIDAVQHANYSTRVSDDFSAFCGVTFEDYKAAYAKRDEAVLQASIVTNASFILNSVCGELVRQRIETPFTGSVTVEVNLWPYQLDAETRRDIENAIASLLPVDVHVRSCYVPIEQLTIRMVASRYTGMIIYNFAEWLQLHCREFEEVNIPGVTIIAPKLHTEGQTAFPMGYLGEGTEDLDPYEMISMLHAPLMGLEWAEPAHFCMVSQRSVESYEGSSERPDAYTPPTSA